MRFTPVLHFPQLRRRLLDYSWHRWRKPAINDLGVEKKLREEGIEVVDANAYVKEMDRELYPPDWRELPELEPTFPQPPKEDRTHPNWHDEPRLIFDSESFPIEGVPQAQAFTKSVQIKEGLPDKLLEMCEFQRVKNPEGAAEKFVKQAFLWDAYLEKLPNLMNFDYPTRKFRRPIGIPARRSNDILVRNFLRLIEQEHLEIAMSRIISNDEALRVNVTRHGTPVQFKLDPLLNVMSKKHLLPFNTDLKVTEEEPVPEIYPFLSTANFDDRNIYEEKDFFAVSPNSAFPNIHTSVFSHHIPGSHTHLHPRWNDNRFTGTTILYGFATAALMAHRRFGDSPAVLPEPVTSQVLHLTGKEFQFAVFQLNTLDLDDSSDSKVKNIVWLTEKINLFDHIENKLGTEIFEGYNPEPFKILKGMYCSPTSS